MKIQSNKWVGFGLLIPGLILIAMINTGCSSSSSFTPSGNPLLDLRNPELLDRDRVKAAIQAWDEVESGVRVRERTRQAFKNLAWSNATSPELRYVVLDLILSDSSEEGEADSRAMARLLLPTERSPDAVRIIVDRAVEREWEELVPAMVRSYARLSPNVPDSDRDEARAIRALRSTERLEETIFDVFLNPTKGLSDTREQAVLRLSQRTRDDAWGLLSRLDSSGEIRRVLLGLVDLESIEEGSVSTVLGLQRMDSELGVLPNTASELGWLMSLIEHSDKRNNRLNLKWWDETRDAMNALGDEQRVGLEMRHLESIRWAANERPGWIELDREALFAVANQRLKSRVHHKRKHEKGELPRKERLGDWYAMMSWGDLLSLLTIDEALANRAVVEQIFVQRALDKKDTSTEYGGVIEFGGDSGARAVLYRPRSRDRLDDHRFVASDDMYRFSDRSLVHYHMHVNKRDNSRYAGPSSADFAYARSSGRSNLVFTSLGKRTLNVDMYLPNGVVIDLGQIHDVESE